MQIPKNFFNYTRNQLRPEILKLNEKKDACRAALKLLFADEPEKFKQESRHMRHKLNTQAQQTFLSDQKSMDATESMLTEVEQRKMIEKDPSLMQSIKNPSESLQRLVVNQNWKNIQYIENPLEELQLALVRDRGTKIEYIKNPTEQVQLEAVKQCGEAIQYIKNPSEELQLIAVRQNGNALKVIKNPSEAVKKAAIEKNYYVI